MTMAAESKGSCSTAAALLDLVDEVAEEDVPALVALLDAVEFEVELDTWGCVSRMSQKGKSRRGYRPLEHVEFSRASATVKS